MTYTVELEGLQQLGATIPCHVQDYDVVWARGSCFAEAIRVVWQPQGAGHVQNKPRRLERESVGAIGDQGVRDGTDGDSSLYGQRAWRNSQFEA